MLAVLELESKLVSVQSHGFPGHHTFHFLLDKPDSKDSRQSGEIGLVMSWREKIQFLEGSGAETHSGIQNTPASNCPLALNLGIGRGLTPQAQ